MSMTARPTTYRGIDMRSRTEARFAAFLDRVEISWRYEPCAFAGPEVLELRISGQVVFIDVKGTASASQLEDLRARMRLIWESAPSAILAVAPADWERQRLLLDLPWRDRSRGYVEGFFGTCPAGHAAFGWLRNLGVPLITCGRCGFAGSPTLFLRPFDEVR